MSNYPFLEISYSLGTLDLANWVENWRERGEERGEEVNHLSTRSKRYIEFSIKQVEEKESFRQRSDRTNEFQWRKKKHD